MDYQCYYCEQTFDSKEKLYDHLEVHAKTESEQKKTGKKNKNWMIFCSHNLELNFIFTNTKINKNH